MPERPPRADAHRNRNRVLAAAREVFAAEGLDAPLARIAEVAGLSRATQHRHFPTRESLLTAIFDDNIDEIAQVARTADPAGAYVAGLFATVEIHHRNSGFLAVFQHAGTAEEIKLDIADRFLEIFVEPLRAAHRSGQIRPDLQLADTLLLVSMLGALSTDGPYDPGVRLARAKALILDAISVRRSPGALSS